MEKPVRASAGRKATVAQYLSSSSTTPMETNQSFCNYPDRVCMRSKLDGYDYCVRHILRDRTAPYKQCSYVSNRTGHKCSEAALRTERRESYCTLHARKLARSRHPDGRRRSRQDDPAVNLLAELECHATSTSRQSTGKIADIHDDDMSTCSLDEANLQPLTEQLVTLDAADSDAESIDSEQENALKYSQFKAAVFRHAGVYSAEEIALVFRDKLIRLQSLYIDQFKRLHHRLREKRRHYLHAMKRTIPMPAADTFQSDINRETDQLKLRALNRYYRKYGKEALLVRQCKERRIAVSEGAAYKPPITAKCQHVACSDVALPLSKYCLQHIQDDSRQVLFSQCSFAGSKCKQVVPGIFAEPRCHLHTSMQPVVYRYSICEQDQRVKEEAVDIVDICDSQNNATSVTS